MTAGTVEQCKQISDLVVQYAESKTSVAFVQFDGDDLRAPRCQSTKRLQRMCSADNPNVASDDWWTSNQHLLRLGFK